MIDLHCHSNFSDGESTPNELLKKAEEIGLKYFSITDHDNCFAYENIDSSNFSGTLIPGVEIATSFEKHIIEVLGYGVNTKQINKWSNQNKIKHIQYTEVIYNNLINIFEKEGIQYTPTNKNKVINGKIKQYFYEDLLKYKKNKEIIGMEILNSFADFTRKGLNNPNSILFINENNKFPTLEETIELIHKNGGLCFLAHLYQYNVEDHMRFLDRIRNAVKIDGIEIYHSSFSEEQIKQINQYADIYNLYKCGGSDYHGKLKPGIKLGLDLQISEKLIMPWVNQVTP